MAKPHATPPVYSEQDIERFERSFERLDVDSCWLWRGPFRLGGPVTYGMFCANYRQDSAHRIAFFLYHNRWPDLCVCHTCDVGVCVNPHHLFEGTYAENNADRNNKGRSAKGVNHRSAKLNDGAVREIRAAYARGGVTLKALGARYGVTHSTILKAITGNRWKHVT
jgi:hypothetical protein